jgi:hypothetical protein
MVAFFAAIHGRDEFAGGPDNSARTLNQRPTKGFNLTGTPLGGAYGRGASHTRTHLHLQLTGEVMCEKGSEFI